MKPARDIIAKAVPRQSSGFYAQFAYPGAPAELVSGDDDKPIVFRDQRRAEFAAMTYAINGFNAERLSTRGKAEKHEKMQAKDFAVMISNLGFSPLDIAQLWGTSEDRVVEWMHGESVYRTGARCRPKSNNSTL